MKRLALLIWASGAAAQPLASRLPAPEGGIVVQGHQQTKAEVHDEVRRMSPYPSDHRALARFNKPLCFSVAGLSREFAIAFAERMVDDAEAAGAVMAGDKCQPNVKILVVDGNSEDFRRARQAISPKAADDVPALVQTVTGARSRDGDLLRRVPGSSTYVTLKVPQATHIGIYTREDIDEVVLIFRRDAVLGKTSTQLADYAAMRGLAETRDAPLRKGTTILSLFDPNAAPPDGLTAFDATYLKALYAGPGNVAASVKLGTITRKIYDQGK